MAAKIAHPPHAPGRACARSSRRRIVAATCQRVGVRRRSSAGQRIGDEDESLVGGAHRGGVEVTCGGPAIPSRRRSANQRARARLRLGRLCVWLLPYRVQYRQSRRNHGEEGCCPFAGRLFGIPRSWSGSRGPESAEEHEALGQERSARVLNSERSAISRLRQRQAVVKTKPGCAGYRNKFRRSRQVHRGGYQNKTK
jgi:hypothetical protein